MDIDDVPIGVKPTNQMSFEQLIEEKLKIQSELDEEQARFGRGGGKGAVRGKARPAPLKKRTSTSLSSLVVATPAQTAAMSDPVSPVPSTTSDEQFESAAAATNQQQTVRSIQPKKFLKKGEGLSRYQPGSAAKRMQQQKAKRKSGGGLGSSGGSSGNLKANNTNTNSESRPPPNRVISTAQSRMQNSKPNMNGKQNLSQSQAKQQQQQQPAKPITTVTTTANLETNNRAMTMTSSRSRSPSSIGEEDDKDEDDDVEDEEEDEIEYKPIQIQQTVSSNLATAKNLINYAVLNQIKAQEEFDLYKKNNNKVEKNEEEHQENEEEELREFEKLEKYTEEHPSFRSSISYVDAFLQRRTSTDRRLSIDSNATIQSQTLIEEEEEEHNYGGECSPPKGPREQLAYVEQLINKIKNNPGLVACNVDTLRSEFMNMMLNEGGHKDNNPRIASSSSLSAANNNMHSSSSSPNSSSSSTSSTSSPDAADYSFNSSGMLRKVKRLDEKKSSTTTAVATKGNNNFDEEEVDYNGYNSENYKDDDEEDENNIEEYKVEEEKTSNYFDGEKEISVYERFLKASKSQATFIQSLQQVTSKQVLNFDDSKTWADQTLKKPSKNDDYSEEPTESRSRIVIKKTSTIEKTSQQQQQQQQQQSNSSISQQDQDQFDRARRIAAAANSEAASVNASANVLHEKLSQLEAEIEKFRRKNAELAEAKRQAENDKRLLETERRLFDKEKREEMARLKELHDEEMRKLRVEKKTFEQYKQSIKEKPTRKERDEIESLKKQLHELNEEMKLRESRWTANNNRMKERIEALEKEKSELKESLRLAERQRIESLVKVTTTSAQQPMQPSSRNSLSKSLKSPPLYNNQLLVDDSRIQRLSLDNNNTVVASQQSPVSYPFLQTQTNGSQATYEDREEAIKSATMKRTTSEKSLSGTTATTISSSSSSIGSSSSSSSMSTKRQQSAPYLLTAAPQPPSHSSLESLKSSSSSSSSSAAVSSHISPSTHKRTLLPQPEQQQQQQQHHKQVTWSLDRNSVEFIDYDDETTRQDEEEENGNSEGFSRRSSSSGSSLQPFVQPLVQEVIVEKPQTPDFAVATIGGQERRLRVLQVRQFDDGHFDELLEDGTLLTVFSNGTIKEISPDKRHILVKFYNGDRKEVNHELDTETYFYNETNIKQTFYGTGLQILEFPNGQIEKHHPDNKREIFFADKSQKIINPDGSEELRQNNGIIVYTRPNSSERTIEYPNGQREVHTSDYKKREYPDGSVKIVHSKTGISETRYANGRVRIKDANGNLISDTHLTA